MLESQSAQVNITSDNIEYKEIVVDNTMKRKYPYSDTDIDLPKKSDQNINGGDELSPLSFA